MAIHLCRRHVLDHEGLGIQAPSHSANERASSLYPMHGIVPTSLRYMYAANVEEMHIQHGLLAIDVDRELAEVFIDW